MPATELATARSPQAVLDDCRALVEPAMRSAVDELPGRVRHIAGYHFAWWDADGQPDDARNGGKTLRPALVLLAAEAVGGRAADAVPAAVAVEFVHNFSLLHDDVMDGDTTRRHRPTAWRVFGASAAILAGDALLTAAVEVLVGCGHPRTRQGVRMLTRAVIELVAGQSSDVAFERRDAVSLPECVGMARAKTGALLGCAPALGALLGGGRPGQVRRLGRFGTELGLAFQHIDDLLGIWGEPAVTGKPVHSDLTSRKKSLPVVAALASGTSAGAELANLYRAGDRLSPAELRHAAYLVEQAGGRAFSQAEADRLLEQALDHLTAANPMPQPAAELAALAGLATRRVR